MDDRHGGSLYSTRKTDGGDELNTYMDTTDQRLNSAGSNEILKDMQNLAENPNALLQHPDGNYIYEQINEEN